MILKGRVDFRLSDGTLYLWQYETVQKEENILNHVIRSLDESKHYIKFQTYLTLEQPIFINITSSHTIELKTIHLNPKQNLNFHVNFIHKLPNFNDLMKMEPSHSSSYSKLDNFIMMIQQNSQIHSKIDSDILKVNKFIGNYGWNDSFFKKTVILNGYKDEIDYFAF
tara:strand:+ start:14397 stop:14897 length:501 start_codon:yes stop_codon:yes gene_type:complete